MRDLVALYPGHIWKENYLLFSMTDKILSEQEQQELVEQLETVEKSIGLEVRERFEYLAEELSKKAQQL
jgi:hemerythrin-like domain-containing protein